MEPAFITATVAIAIFLGSQLIVEPLKEKRNKKKELIKSKLEKLYSPIYSEVFLIQSKLIANVETTEVTFNKNEPPYLFHEPVIDGPFDEIIDPITKTVLSNIYLLDDSDLELWVKFEKATDELEHAIENESGPAGSSNILLTERYSCFKDFIDSSVVSYKKYRKLYNRK